ncbi:MAG: hypothetical protein JO067_14705 [Cupriavidus sp.]|nr:hypothetical protein [Cupriavidus sp.]
MTRLLSIWMLCVSLALAGCTYYGYPPGTVPASYDRSFFAAADAMRDQGVSINVQNQVSGLISGNYGSTAVTANVRQQQDGSVVVQFHADDTRDPGLVQRISQSYDRRMGR